MSIFFEHDGHTIWNPSSNKGRLFVETVRALEQCVDMTSGIGEVLSDEVAVNPGQLQGFLIRVVGHISENQSLTVLAHGVCVHAAAMLDCMGESSESLLKKISLEWIAEANYIARHHMNPVVQE